MNILILNWRGVSDPLAGGAEVATFEHAKNFVKNHNAKVLWVSPKYKKGPKKEILGGVDFVYIAKPLNRDSALNLIFTFPYFYLSVFYFYITKYRKTTDVLIDQVHGLPYLTPLYSNKKIVVYIHEVAGDIWDKMYKFPISNIGKLIEKIVFFPYRLRASTFVAVSNSTKKDLEKLGVASSNIKVVSNGVSLTPLSKLPQKNKAFTVTFLNRLVKMKGIERAIDVFARYHSVDKSSLFYVIGRGEGSYVKKLKEKVGSLGLEGSVKFYGFVSESKKIELLKKSHVLINTSYKEGWGLVNIEANSQGTPAVAFNVNGNRESIVNGVNGYIVEEELDLMVKAIKRVKGNGPGLQKSSLEYSKKFDWEEQSARFYKILSA